jgi:hypothetical protein
MQPLAVSDTPKGFTGGLDEGEEEEPVPEMQRTGIRLQFREL